MSWLPELPPRCAVCDRNPVEQRSCGRITCVWWLLARIVPRRDLEPPPADPINRKSPGEAVGQESKRPSQR